MLNPHLFQAAASALSIQAALVTTAPDISVVFHALQVGQRSLKVTQWDHTANEFHLVSQCFTVCFLSRKPCGKNFEVGMQTYLIPFLVGS